MNIFLYGKMDDLKQLKQRNKQGITPNVEDSNSPNVSTTSFLTPNTQVYKRLLKAKIVGELTQALLQLQYTVY